MKVHLNGFGVSLLEQMKGYLVIKEILNQWYDINFVKHLTFFYAFNNVLDLFKLTQY